MLKLSKLMMLEKLEKELVNNLKNVNVIMKDEESLYLTFSYEDVYVYTHVERNSKEFYYEIATREYENELHKCRCLVESNTRYVEEILYKVYENNILSKVYKNFRDYENFSFSKLDNEKFIFTLDDKLKVYIHVTHDEIITTIYDLVDKEYILNEEILYEDEINERMKDIFNEVSDYYVYYLNRHIELND